ncbi:MAG: hypothetical protein PVH88_01995 [Ignavibacteria bacterium]|jgi:hypothetical protein
MKKITISITPSESFSIMYAMNSYINGMTVNPEIKNHKELLVKLIEQISEQMTEDEISQEINVTELKKIIYACI